MRREGKQRNRWIDTVNTKVKIRRKGKITERKLQREKRRKNQSEEMREIKKGPSVVLSILVTNSAFHYI